LTYTLQYIYGNHLSPPLALLVTNSELHASRHSQRLAGKLAALDTRVPLSVVASTAGGAALEDMPIGAVGIDRLVAAELTLNFVAATLGRNAGLLMDAISTPGAQSS